MSDAESLPEVSVIVCTRNRRAWLEEALDSVVAQTGVACELLVVVDASTDDTAAWLQHRAGPGLRVWLQTEPTGRAAAANRALAEARGEFVMFLDDDDRLRAGALQTLVRALRGAPAAVAAVGARWDWFCDGRGGGRRDSHPWLARRRDVRRELLFGWSAVSGQNLYRTAIVRAAGGYTVTPDLWPCDDRELWLRVTEHGPIVLRPEIVMTYRVHPAQWRPPDLKAIRERVARRAIRRLPRAQRRAGLQARRSAALVTRAEEALGEGRWAEGVGLAWRAWLAAPGLWCSPLIGPWVARRLLRRVWHRLRR